MIRSVFLLLSVMVTQCTSPQKTVESERYFNSGYLNNLALDNLPSFWRACSLYALSSCYPMYCHYDRHIDQRFYSSQCSKWLGVVVFTDSSYAYAGAEAWIKGNTAAYKKGDSTTGKTWWYSECGSEFTILYLPLQKLVIIQKIMRA